MPTPVEVNIIVNRKIQFIEDGKGWRPDFRTLFCLYRGGLGRRPRHLADRFGRRQLLPPTSKRRPDNRFCPADEFAERKNQKNVMRTRGRQNVRGRCSAIEEKPKTGGPTTPFVLGRTRVGDNG